MEDVLICLETRQLYAAFALKPVSVMILTESGPVTSIVNPLNTCLNIDNTIFYGKSDMGNEEN